MKQWVSSSPPRPIFIHSNLFRFAATILLPTPRLAHALSAKLHNHVFKGLLITAAVKSSWDLVQRLGRGKGGGRLVVRNLGFDVRCPFPSLAIDTNSTLISIASSLKLGYHSRSKISLFEIRSSSFHHASSRSSNERSSRFRLHLLPLPFLRHHRIGEDQRNSNLLRYGSRTSR